MFTKVFGVQLLTKQLQKVDDGSLIVPGYFTSDNYDELGDLITRAATDRAIPAYRQWGNIRYMHQPRPVGKVLRIGEVDGLAWNQLELKVVDPQTVFEVENGLLPALSVGIFFGMDDFEINSQGGWTINNYQLAEISLVDHPANYDAKLDLPKGTNLAAAVQRYGFTKAIENYGVNLDVIDKEKVRTEKLSVQKSPACRQEGESEADCVSRKIPELLDEGYDQEQAQAIAYDMCSESCGDKSLENEEETMKDKVLEEVTTEDEIVTPDEQEEVIEQELDITTEPEAEEIVEELNVSDEPEIEEVVEEVPEYVTVVEFTIFRESINDQFKSILDAITGLSETVSEAAQRTLDADELEASEEVVDEPVVEVEQEEAAEVVVEELSIDEEPVVDSDPIADRVVAVENKIAELDALLLELSTKPQNRSAGVLPVDTDEEEAEEEVVEKNLRTSIQEYFKSRGLTA